MSTKGLILVGVVAIAVLFGVRAIQSWRIEKEINRTNESTQRMHEQNIRVINKKVGIPITPYE